MAEKYVDTSKFNMKIGLVKTSLRRAGPAIVANHAQRIHDLASANLEGVGAKAGSSARGGADNVLLFRTKLTMPIRRITGNLSRSLQMAMLNIYQWIVWADSKIAPYAKFVHDGTKYVEARRFIFDPVDQNRVKFQKELKEGVLKAIRIPGRK